MNDTNLSNLSTEQLEVELAKRKKVKEIQSLIEAHPLKCETVTRIVVDYSDLERFIQKIYNRVYESACVEEMNNDTEKTYNIDGKCEIWEMPTFNEVEKFLYDDGKPPCLRALMQYLANKNIIEKGIYTVKWSW